jgi:hypothetical protein
VVRGEDGVGIFYRRGSCACRGTSSWGGLETPPPDKRSLLDGRKSPSSRPALGSGAVVYFFLFTLRQSVDFGPERVEIDDEAASARRRVRALGGREHYEMRTGSGELADLEGARERIDDPVIR